MKRIVCFHSDVDFGVMTHLVEEAHRLLEEEARLGHEDWVHREREQHGLVARAVLVRVQVLIQSHVGLAPRQALG